MQTVEIKYKTKTAVTNDILKHLEECKINFNPPLAKRVSIEEYSQKIFEKSITFEAWGGEELVGLVAAYFNEVPDHLAFITNVSVLKNFTSMGIASKLLENCIEYACAKKIKTIKLEVGSENTHAIGLYGKYGFTSESIYGEFLRMRLDLAV